MATKSDKAELRKLRKLVCDYLSATMDIPKRAVDCDQELVSDLESKLVESARWVNPRA